MTDGQFTTGIVVDSSVYTTFYLGALVDPEDGPADVSYLPFQYFRKLTTSSPNYHWQPADPTLAVVNARKPHFSGIFKISYGLDREQLEELNFMIRSSDTVEYPSSSSEVGKRKRKRGSESVVCHFLINLHTFLLI